MKKLSQISLSVILFLTLALPAFAQGEISIDPCNSTTPGNTNVTNTGNGSNDIRTQLCKLEATGAGSLVAKVVIGIIIVATVISLFFLIIGGIRWILSGGDKAKVDAARSTIVAAIVGLIITFLAYFIIKVVLNLFGLNLNSLTLPNLASS